MQIHFYRLLRFLGTFFAVCFGLTLAKFFGFDFALELSFLWELVLVILLVYLFLEAVQNREFLKEYCQRKLREWKEDLNEETKLVQRKIVASSPLFQSGPGQSIAYLFAHLCTSSRVIASLLKKTIISKYMIFTLCLIGVVFEIFVITSTLDLAIIFLTCLWVLTARMFKFSGNVSIGGGLVFLTLTPFLLVVQKDLLAEKTANWAFMFLLIGIIQTGWHYRSDITERY